MKKKRFTLFIFFLPLLMGAKMNTPYHLYGVKGKLLTNITTRLKELKENKPLATLSDEILRQEIAKAMAPYGYFNPHIQVLHFEKTLSIHIDPGTPLKITQLTIQVIGPGKDNEEIREAWQGFPLKQGDALHSPRYEEGKLALMTAAERQGYLHAAFEKAEILVDEKKNTATVRLIFNTGPQYYFGQLRFDPTYISPWLLARFIPFEYGQPYNTEKILSLNNYLVSSGYFKSVEITPHTNVINKSHIPIDVHFQPAKRFNYTLGAGYGTDTGIRGRVDLNISPLNRAGHKFNFTALGSSKQNAVQTQYIIPGYNPLVYQYEWVNTFSNLRYDTGSSNSLLSSVLQRKTLPHFQRVLSLNALYERFKYDDAPKFEKFNFYPKASFSWFKQTNLVFSPNNYKIILQGLIANRALLSQLNFSQVLLDARAAYTFAPLHTRFYFHTMQGLTQIENINELPLSLALLLGGSDNLKGYSFNSLNPGKHLTYNGFEIQKETKENWYLIGFFDAGGPSVFFKKDAGIGVMWVSPVGPIKIGLAQPLKDRSNRFGHKLPRLVINMGPDL